MIPTRDIAPAALASILRRAPLSPEKIAFAWRMAVGPAVADATGTPVLDGHVLRVTARDAAWRNEVERSAGLVRRRVNEVLGEGLVRGIRVDLE